MPVSTTISLSTKGHNDIVDITDQVEQAVRKSGMQEGLVTVFVPGSTAGVTTIEYEPGAVADLKAAVTRLVPDNIPYKHHETSAGEENGMAHIRASLIGPSLTIPITKGRLTLGTWQQVVFCDFDTRPRSRQVALTIVGAA